MEEKRIKRLYALLDRMKREGDTDFELERMCGETVS